jgi:phytoene dehydrogenase-like protein
LLARRRESHARESRSAEWREALGRLRSACGVDDDAEGEGRWQSAAAALQCFALASPSAADRLFGDDSAAHDAAELRSLLALMAGGPKKSPASSQRATVALVPVLAAAPSVVLAEGGTRNAAEVLAALRTRAQLSPSQTLEAVERCPRLLGFASERVRDNLLFLLGASEASAAATATTTTTPPLLSVLALGALASLGRETSELRATWEFLVGGGPAFEPQKDLRAWPSALEFGEQELRRRWALARRLGVRLRRPAEEGGRSRSSTSWPARAWVEATPDAIDRTLGLGAGEAARALEGGSGGDRR